MFSLLSLLSTLSFLIGGSWFASSLITSDVMSESLVSSSSSKPQVDGESNPMIGVVGLSQESSVKDVVEVSSGSGDLSDDFPLVASRLLSSEHWSVS